MHLRALAVVACAASAAASVFLASTPGMGLARRDEPGYQPELTTCNKDGDTCAAVCGAGYDQCASSKSDETHCFNPTVGQTCCMDGSGNSCDKGFFCTNDLNKKNWCCPENMSLEECATKFGVTSGLQLAKPSSTSTPPAPSSTSSAISTSSVISTSAPSPPATTTTSATPIVKVQVNSTTYSTSTTQELAVCSSSVVQVPVNSTIANVGPTQPVGSVPYVPSVVPPPSNITLSGAAASSGVGSLLLVVAGFVAVM